ncbi:ABC-2 family transporter protein [Thermomonospora echinospora]|uniref:ABC-2 family transporter protein n=1 Tax=Thermomonospora echinospora TaxID=1992 RepID=A0A1H6DQI7_9ACTN|nr:ABC transporter permease [Thermomonospora echinospora]SEG87511.1 ABC-2 family transporter protein [Thermomonospora echinospora]
MTAPATSRPGTSASTDDPPARFGDLLAAEWIKLWSLRSTFWVLGLGALTLIGLNVQATLADHRLMASWSAQRLADYNWMNDAFGQSPYLLLMICTGAIGAITIAGEYTSGLIRTTFAAVPARRSVVAAKAAVVTVVMTILGTVVAVTSFGVTQAILSTRGGGYSFTDPGVPQAIAASALIAPVCALIGMGVGALIRHTAASVIGVFAVLVMLPELTKGRSYAWVVDLHNAMPWPAWATLRNSPWQDVPDPYAATATGSWIVLALWPLAAVLLATLAVHRRDP